MNSNYVQKASAQRVYEFALRTVRNDKDGLLNSTGIIYNAMPDHLKPAKRDLVTNIESELAASWDSATGKVNKDTAENRLQALASRFGLRYVTPGIVART